jgi:nucleoid-associated protein YgaU
LNNEPLTTKYLKQKTTKQSTMGFFSFNKKAGKKVLPTVEPAAPPAQSAQKKAEALLAYVKGLGLPYQNVLIMVQGDDVILKGDVDKQSDSERIVLAVGNVEGVDKVDNQMKVKTPAPEARYHTVAEGDWLSKIAQTYYGDAKKFDVIFEANKPMLKDPDEIYPGQVLRIPNL